MLERIETTHSHARKGVKKYTHRKLILHDSFELFEIICCCLTAFGRSLRILFSLDDELNFKANYPRANTNRFHRKEKNVKKIGSSLLIFCYGMCRKQTFFFSRESKAD